MSDDFIIEIEEIDPRGHFRAARGRHRSYRGAAAASALDLTQFMYLGVIPKVFVMARKIRREFLAQLLGSKETLGIGGRTRDRLKTRSCSRNNKFR